MNDSVGPDGLVPTLLVYGSLPCLCLQSHKPTRVTFQFSVAFRKDTEKITKHFQRKQVNSSVRELNGPDAYDIHLAPIDSYVLFYRPGKDK